MSSSFSSSDVTRTQWQPAPPAPPEPPGVDPAPEPRRRRARSLFWPGFFLGFLLLAAFTCGGMGLALGVNRIQLSDFARSGPVWTPPAVTPTAAVAAGEANAGPSSALHAGDSVRNLTNSRVNLRTSPGYQGKGSADVVGLIEPGAALTLLDASAAADGLTWWRVRYQAPGGRILEGWVAEATASGVQILGRQAMP